MSDPTTDTPGDNPVRAASSGDAVQGRAADAAPDPIPQRSGIWPIRDRDRVLFALACAAALVFMVLYCIRTSRWGSDPIEVERQAKQLLDFKIDLNAATWVEWSQLREIGPELAKRIIEERERAGPFRSVDDLERVKGIGPKRIENLRPFIRDGSQRSNREPDAYEAKSTP